MLVIREFEPKDAKAVSFVVRCTMQISNSADYPPEILQPLINYFSPEKILQINLVRICLVAETSDGIVGTAALEKAELCTFFVLPDYQNKKIGTRLLEKIEQIGREKKIRTITFGASLTAVPFYEKMGYRKTGRIKESTGGMQIGMEKKLE